MGYLLRRNQWILGKPCSCCRQFENDQAKKEETRAKRATRPKNPPPETIQETTVPTYSTLSSIITRQMNYYCGYGSPYGNGIYSS
jgi:hypothetical protein